MNTGAASSQTASPCPSLSSSNATHWSSYATSNRVNGSDTLISYARAGNVTAAGNYQYLYDAEGRQCAVANLLTSSVTQYVYDAEGRRVASFPWPSGGQMPSAGSTCPAPASFGGLPVTTAFLHDWVGGLEATLTRVSSISGWDQDVMANGQLVASYSWQGMPPPGPPIAPTLTFHLNDWLGTKRLDINQSGQAVSWWSSDPFGNYLTPHGAGTDPSARHFTGQVRDAESGNDFFNARYYSSLVGRFLMPDPSGLVYGDPTDPQSMNLYAYVQNKPMTFIDPSGLYDTAAAHACLGELVNSSANEGSPLIALDCNKVYENLPSTQTHSTSARLNSAFIGNDVGSTYSDGKNVYFATEDGWTVNGVLLTGAAAIEVGLPGILKTTLDLEQMAQNGAPNNGAQPPYNRIGPFDPRWKPNGGYAPPTGPDCGGIHSAANHIATYAAASTAAAVFIPPSAPVNGSIAVILGLFSAGLNSLGSILGCQ